MYKKSAHHGFTLIEMLIYMAVLVLVASALVVTFFSLRDTFERNRVERELASAATNTLERLLRSIRDASDIGILSTFDSASPPVILALVDAQATEFKQTVTGGTIVVSENSVPIGPLVPQGVSVDSLIFRSYSNSQTKAVRVELTLSVATDFASTTKTFYTTAVLRGSYD